MLIVSHVCAEFHDQSGAVIFAVTPATRKSFIEAPEAIRQDPLFDLLVTDGSLEAGFTNERKRALENDPETGFDASGKAIHLPKQEEETPKSANKAKPKASKSAKADPETNADNPAVEPTTK